MQVQMRGALAEAGVNPFPLPDDDDVLIPETGDPRAAFGRLLQVEAARGIT